MYSLDRILIEKFRKAITYEIDGLRYIVAQGMIEDIQEYKKVCSKVDGLQNALSIFDDLVQTLGEENN